MRPDHITSISDALHKISALTAVNEDLSESLARERITFGKIIYDLTTQLEVKKEECKRLNRHLHQAQEIMLDKDQLICELQGKITAMEQSNAAMKEKVAEGIRKGWQLQELCDMLLGKRSEKFVPEAQAVNTVIQQTLGAEFDAAELETIIKVAATPADTRQAESEQQKSSRKKKRHQAHKGRRVQPSYLEVVTETIDITTDKAGLRPMGKKVTTYYDYQPGKIIKVQQEYLQYISEDKKIICEPVKPRMVEKGIVGNTLLAHLHTRRFAYGDPYSRQLKFIKNTTGVSFAAATVNGWEENTYKKLTRLLKCLKKVVMQASYLKADETRLSYLNDVGKGKPSNGWLWVFLAPAPKLVLFEFNPSRSQLVPGQILKDFKGILQTDGLASYTAAFKNNDQVTMMSL